MAKVWAVAALGLLGPATAAAQEQRTDALEQRIQELEQRVEELEQRASRPTWPTVKISGYGDVGFFVPIGNGGVGVQQDNGYQVFPEESGFAWVFYGDLLATTVNSRGEAADLGSLPGVDRFDSVHSLGNPSFLVNELNTTITVGLSPEVLFTGSVSFVPRSGHDFAIGDFIDVDLVQLEWIPGQGHTSFFAGKVDSVLGIEYKTRKASQRFGITPSLIARYTTGTAVGLKVRTKLLDEHLVLAASLTNGSFGTEQFHFYREIDSNVLKTVSGRAAVRTHVGKGTLEIGASGQVGSEDNARDEAGLAWFAGVDAEYQTVSLDLKAQWLMGKAPGDPVTLAYGLDLHSGGYLEADWVATPHLGVYARGEFRDARVWLADQRLYLTQGWRATAGVRWVFSPNITLKAEYLHNGEYGRVPEFLDDVATSSLVVTY